MDATRSVANLRSHAGAWEREPKKNQKSRQVGLDNRPCQRL